MKLIKTLLASAALLALVPAHAVINVTSPAFTYSESFDSLTTSATAVAWANDNTLAGWSLFISSGAAAPTYLATNGAGSTSSFTSYGATGSGERALGALGSGGAYYGSPASGATAGWIAVAFTNSSGNALNSFTVGFDGEQWRNGGNASTAAQTMTLQYGYGATFGTVGTWNTPGGTFNWTSLVNTATAGAVDGNGVGKVAGVGGTVSTNWAAGDTLWVRWIELNDTGNDHGLAIDNLSFSVTAVPEPSSYALFAAGIAALGFVARRRR